MCVLALSAGRNNINEDEYQMLSTKYLTAFSTNTILILVLSFVNLAPQAVLSQSNDDANDPVSIYKQAGIDANQESAIRKLAQEYDQENAVKLQSLGQMLQELRDMAYQKNLNESAMLTKQEEINKLQSEMAIQRIKLVIKIRGLLTAAQNEKLVSTLQNRAHSEEQAHLK